jgi:hypothetical protein
MQNILKEFENIKFFPSNFGFGDGRSSIKTISLFHPDPLSFKVLISIQITICNTCGNYSYTNKSDEEKIYCKCKNIMIENAWERRCKRVYNEKLLKVLDQLISSIDSDSEEYIDGHYLNAPRLTPSRYGHEGPCYPDSRTCNECWHYWCGTCNGGLGGMYGSCIYKKCRQGRRNLNL